MAKRSAAKQLTMDNYDQDDEEDYTGTTDDGPQLASDDVLKNRPMAKAKRRSDLNSDDSSTKRSSFSGFSGFKGFATNTAQNPSFNAFKAFSQQSDPKDNTFKTSLLPSTQTNGEKPEANPKSDSSTPVEEMTTEDSEDLYNTKLSELNKCFFQHISGYMSRSEFFDFTQVCKEYIDYHKKIESETKPEESTGFKSQSMVSTSVSASQSSVPNLTTDPIKSSQTVFGSQSVHSSTSVSTPPTIGLFSTQVPQKEESSPFAKPNIQFGLSPSKPLLNSGFNDFRTSKITAKPDDNATEETDEPPKVESIEHKEPDSVFTQKCKLFFKKGDEWCQKGVGYLYIKKEPSSTSNAQLLIRADNKLGNILLHITLNESLPVSKAQNKGVLLTCIPNPPLDPKAPTAQESVTFLIRVKDTEHLFDNLVNYKSEK